MSIKMTAALLEINNDIVRRAFIYNIGNSSAFRQVMAYVSSSRKYVRRSPSLRYALPSDMLPIDIDARFHVEPM